MSQEDFYKQQLQGYEQKLQRQASGAQGSQQQLSNSYRFLSSDDLNVLDRVKETRIAKQTLETVRNALEAAEVTWKAERARLYAAMEHAEAEWVKACRAMYEAEQA